MHFIHWGYLKIPKGIVEYFHTLVVLLIYIKECPWDWTSHHPYGNPTSMQILDCIQSRKYCEVIMDDLLFNPSKEKHMNKLEDLLKALLKNGLKISPNKCQLHKTSLQYMGNEIFIENKKVCVKPLRSRLEVIQSLQPPKTPKRCRSFAGVVNFLSMFCPKLQRLLKPIYDLTRKGGPFVWGKDQQNSFEEIKCRLIRLPVLCMLNKTGRFHLYSDTSKFATGSALYQIQNGKPKLIAYTSKRLPEAAKSYSITELELCGLAINIASFSHLPKRVDFDAIVDHLALTHIIKSKMEPATTRIKRLLELISSCSFNLYYMKGKDMILSDFLSWQDNDDSNLNRIIPISFDMYKILGNSLNNLDKNNSSSDSKYLVQMYSQAKTSGTNLLEVHGVEKSLNPNLWPERATCHFQTRKVWEAVDGSRKSRIKEKKAWSHQSSNKPTIEGATGNSRKNQNSNRENKQHTQYKQCKWQIDK